ncbi:MAG: hypothetical protein ABJ013_00605 [Halioglobus sp.]
MRFLQSRITSTAIALCACLAGCESYDITVNDRLVYTPESLFSDYTIDDGALSECVDQAIVDAKATGPNKLTTLNCSHSTISNLAGLATFTGLTHLKLSSNNIRNLLELQALKSLQELYLDNNVIVDPVPLYDLSQLRVLDLSGNATLQCPDAGAMLVVETLELPAHCR